MLLTRTPVYLTGVRVSLYLISRITHPPGGSRSDLKRPFEGKGMQNTIAEANLGESLLTAFLFCCIVYKIALVVGVDI
jgi:hypothetical protein